MNLNDPKDLATVAFFFGMAAGLLISYLMVATAWRIAASFRLAGAAERIAEKSRQEAEIRFNAARIEEGRARISEIFSQLDAMESGSAVSK